MDGNNFTDASVKALNDALSLAKEHGHALCEPLHLAAVLFGDGETAVGTRVCVKLGVEVTRVRDALHRALAKRPSQSPPPQNVGADSALRTVLDAASKAIKKTGDQLVAQDQLLLALYKEGNNAAVKELKHLGLVEGDVRKALEKMRGGRKVQSRTAESSYEALEKYGIDLVAQAAEGKLDPVIGRDDEIRRVIQILTRRTKNNPVLVGEPGVGKTAVVEGLAQRILANDVPEGLQNIALRTLDMGSLVAGASHRGEFEERLKAVLAEVAAAPPPGIILFIDEVHLVLGAGKADGAMDAANLLKPMLARGELRCIGATTHTEYRLVEKDSAFERRMQPVQVGEPSVDATVSILRGLRERYEKHHGVRIEDSALVAAAALSARYITHRFLPDKAIDLIDEASACRRVQLDSKPEQLDRLERKLLQLEIEATALGREKDGASKKRLAQVQKQLANLREELAPLQQAWDAERNRGEELRALRERLDGMRIKAQQSRRTGDMQRAADLEYYAIPEAEAKLKALELQNAESEARKESMVSATVSESHVLEIVSRWTGVPVARLSEGERTRLLKMAERLRARVIGQDDAVDAVANCIMRSRAGLARADQPTGSFLFLGPTGVGKTELAKALNADLFNGDERSLVRLDMSEYSEAHSVARLVGAPPGYIGHEDGGQLTEAVRKRPYTVVLLDEIEKAHPRVLPVLLQVLDEGRLTDSKGRVVDFTNTAIILTSNIGATELLAGTPDAREKAMEMVRRHFPPEFLNRLSAICTFAPLDREKLRRLVHKAMGAVVQRLAEKGITAELTDAAAESVLNASFEARYGARPVERYLENTVTTELSRQLLTGEIAQGSTVVVDAGADGELRFRKRKKNDAANLAALAG
mmetsp:Transcript_20836/g.40505  ORF Transcript_20836/g.40505 Transcript_20836/m.40505 type:complete len:875 (+) Transcript_20836:108-2732(+)